MFARSCKRGIKFSVMQVVRRTADDERVCTLPTNTPFPR